MGGLAANTFPLNSLPRQPDWPAEQKTGTSSSDRGSRASPSTCARWGQDVALMLSMLLGASDVGALTYLNIDCFRMSWQDLLPDSDRITISSPPETPSFTSPLFPRTNCPLLRPCLPSLIKAAAGERLSGQRVVLSGGNRRARPRRRPSPQVSRGPRGDAALRRRTPRWHSCAHDEHRV